MNKKIIPLALFLATSASYAQVGIGTLNPEATTQLDVVATDKGVLIPRVQLVASTNPSPITKGNSVAAEAGDLSNGLLVYNTVVSNDLVPGFHFWKDGAWMRLVTPVDVQAAIEAAGDNDTKITAFTLAEGVLRITVQNGTNPSSSFDVPVSDLAVALGKDLTVDNSLEITTGGTGAVLVATNIKVKDGGIASNHLAEGSVTPDKLDSGSTTPGLIPVSNADGTVTYSPTIPATSLPAEGNGTLSGNDQINVTNGAGALFHDASLSIKENSITADQIATGAVTTDEIADNTITPADILGATANDGKVLTTVNGVVEWVTPSVDATQVQNAGTISSPGTIAVTGGDASALKDVSLEVAADAITSAHIANGTIVAEDLANASVSPDKMSSETTPGVNAPAGQVPVADGNGGVTYGMLPASSVEGEDLTAADATIVVTDGVGAVLKATNLKVGTDAITADHIAPDAITASELADNAVDNAAIAPDAVTTDKILDGTVAAVDLAAGSVTPDKLNSGSTTPGLIPVSNADGTVTYSPTIPTTSLPADGNGNLTGSEQIIITGGDKALLHDASVSIKPDSITADQIATGAVTTDEILNGTIKPEDILGEATNNGKVLTTVDGAVQWADNPAVVNYTKNTVATTTGTVVIDGTTYKIKRVVKVVPINSTVLGSGATAIGVNRAFTLADLGLNATTAAQILNFRANGGGHSITEFKVVGENLALTSGNMSKEYPSGNYTVIIEFYDAQ